MRSDADLEPMVRGSGGRVIYSRDGEIKAMLPIESSLAVELRKQGHDVHYCGRDWHNEGSTARQYDVWIVRNANRNVNA